MAVCRRCAREGHSRLLVYLQFCPHAVSERAAMCRARQSHGGGNWVVVGGVRGGGGITALPCYWASGRRVG